MLRWALVQFTCSPTRLPCRQVRSPGVRDGVPLAQLEWAHTYDAYQRLASTPDKLERLLRSARNSYRTNRAVPKWCGVDLLRGWAFLLVRADHQAGGDTLNDEWDAVLRTLAIHPNAKPADRPPTAHTTTRRPRSMSNPPLPETFSFKPKQHKDPAFLAAKRARLWEPHIAPMNEFVDRIKQAIEADWGRAAPEGGSPPPVFVPYVDPDSGGIAAKIMFVLESPAGPAALGSGMLSADNNDETAKNVWLAYEASGMPRTHGLHWNAVPWYVGDGKKNAGITTPQVERGRRYLVELLTLAPSIRVVIALGRPAQRSVAGVADQLAERGIELIEAPHPSPIPAASTRGKSLMEIHAAFARAMDLVGP